MADMGTEARASDDKLVLGTEERHWFDSRSCPSLFIISTTYLVMYESYSVN